MKRILTLLIAVLMIISIMPFNASAVSDYKAELLSALSIIQGDPNGNMRYNDKVSRAECAKIVVASSSYRDFVDTAVKTSPFIDVQHTHWASPYVAVGIKNNLFKGYLDATFRPSNTVLYEEAITMFLRVLGYKDEDFGNNWPYDQIDTAKKIGLLNDVYKTEGQELTRRDISLIAYNTLMAKPKGSDTTYISNFNRIIGPKTVVSSNWYDDFYANSDIRVVRDGVKSSVSEVKANDIAYYMEEYKTALVYSKKVTGIYETAIPNKESPTSVTISGITYNIESDEALSKLSSGGAFNYGDTVTLLLGKSGDIADVLSDSSIKDKVYGFLTTVGTKKTTVSGTSVTKPYIKIVLPSGKVCEYITDKDYSKILNNVVSVTLNDGTAIASTQNSNDISGKFIWNSQEKSLGTNKLSNDIKILEVSTTQINENAVTATVFPQRLNGVTLSKNSILYSSKNSDGYVDELILTDTTNDMHTYGIITSAKSNTEQSVSGSYEYISDGQEHSLQTMNKAYKVSTGQAVKISSDGKSVTSISVLNKISANKITDINGSLITAGGKTYTMSDKVQIYVKKSHDYTMITKDELLNMKNGHIATLYTDNSGTSSQRVRIIILS